MVLPILGGIALYVLLGLALWWFISPTTTGQKKDFAQLMAQTAGGAALLFGLYFTWRRVEISQDQQVTERFTRAIEQLGEADDNGKPKLEIRLGGIYALERIARDSPERDYSTVMKVLIAYVRQNTPTHSKEDTELTLGPNEATERRKVAKQQSKSTDEQTEQSLTRAPLEEPRIDIKAVLDVIGRRQEDRVPERYRVTPDLRKINFSKTNLSRAKLWEADLREADLREAKLWEADLRRAVLRSADLREADLSDADLREADLRSADLREADLRSADLSGANLWYADLREAWLPGVNFTEADLRYANLAGAEIHGTNLKGAYLRRTNLNKAKLREANLGGAKLGSADLTKADFSGADLREAEELTQKQLEQAIGNTYTKLPKEFNPPAAWT